MISFRGDDFQCKLIANIWERKLTNAFYLYGQELNIFCISKSR